LLSQGFSAGGSTDMMGIKEREFRPLPDNLSLEELVPKGNFYHRLEERIDLSFYSPDCLEEVFSETGLPA
jgi:hypothetical protein